MLFRTREPERRLSKGIAAVELALLLPLLAFLLVACTDYARLFYYAVSLDGCARNGALYGCRSPYDPTSAYDSLEKAALSDASNIQPPPTITSTKSTDASGNAIIVVTASYPFHTIANYPGIPSVIELNRTVTLPITPDYPAGQ